MDGCYWSGGSEITRLQLDQRGDADSILPVRFEGIAKTGVCKGRPPSIFDRRRPGARYEGAGHGRNGDRQGAGHRPGERLQGAVIRGLHRAPHRRGWMASTQARKVYPSAMRRSRRSRNRKAAHLNYTKVYIRSRDYQASLVKIGPGGPPKRPVLLPNPPPGPAVPERHRPPLNDRGVPTATGKGKWTAVRTRRLVARLESMTRRDPTVKARLASLEVRCALRVCPETSGWIAEFSEHEAD